MHEWGLVASMLGTICLTGVLWSIYREIHIARLNHRYQEMASDVVGTLKDLHATTEAICKRVESNEYLTHQQRVELLQSLSNMETRVTQAIQSTRQQANIFNTNSSDGQVIQGGRASGNQS